MFKKLMIKVLLFAVAVLAFGAADAHAQTSVNNFDDFIAVTTTTHNFNIVLTNDILFSTGGFNILSGTITGTGFALNGNGKTGFKIQGDNDVLFTGGITFNNFLKSVTVNGIALQGVGLFIAGSTQTAVSAEVSTVEFLSSTINFTSNRADDPAGFGSAAQGSGMFAAGSVSAGAGSGTNTGSSGGTAAITFGNSTINFASNSAASNSAGSASQGGGLFAGGAVSAGANAGGGIISSGGTAAVTFDNSTINFTSNSVTTKLGLGAASQGGALFAGGAVSAGAAGSGTNTGSGGITTIIFDSSTINFTGNNTSPGTQGAASQGGALFAGGAVSAGARDSGTNTGSGGITTIKFDNSTINFTSNSAPSGYSGLLGGGNASQGGGLFAGGAVSAGSYGSGVNISSGGITTIMFDSSTVNFTGNNMISLYGDGGEAFQGGGLFAGGAVSAGSYSSGVNISSCGAAAITFNNSIINFTSNSLTSGDYGEASQGGGLFAGGAVSAGANVSGVNISSGGTTTITSDNSTINFTSNSVICGGQGATSQGGGLFAGGAVSAGSYNIGMNSSFGGITAITFTVSTLNFTNNRAVSGGYGAASQGGGIFAGGAVSAGADGNGVNISSGGTTTITSDNSTINFTSNSVTCGSRGAASQGGGLFAGGAVSAGSCAGLYYRGTNSSFGGMTAITFTVSTLNFTSNRAVSDAYGAASQGGGIFAGGAVSAGAFDNNGATVNNISSGGITTITFASSTVNIAGNQATSGAGNTYAQGGGIFAGGSVSAGASYGSINISADGTASIDFTASNIDISGNTAGLGGAVFVAGSVAIDSSTASGGAAVINFTGSTVKFTGNVAASSGGAVYAAGNFSAGSAAATGGTAAVNFTLSEVSFANNTALNGGAVFNNAGIDFKDSFVTFENNQSTGTMYGSAGGAINNTGSGNINFTGGTSIFAGNTATSGGAINNIGNLNFTGNTATFTGNKATYTGGSGGAIVNRGNLNFTGSTATFSGNTTSGSGGAAVANFGTSIFTNSDIVFTGNAAAAGYGGAIYNMFGTMYFEGSKLVFSGNSGQGGAIANDWSSLITFTNSDVIFSGNSDSNPYGGGAIYNFSGDTGAASIAFAGSTVTFAGNTSVNGGAIYNAFGDFGASMITFADGAITFDENVAASSGGAVWTSGSLDFKGGPVKFTNNKAGGLGGALYMSGYYYSLTGSYVTFNTSGGEVLFTGNTAGGTPNDVYMDLWAQLNIDGSNAIRFEDGIVTSTNAATIAINKSGSGAMYLGGNNEIWGAFNISGGDIVMTANATYTGKALEVANGSSALDMRNGTVNTVNVSGNFASDKNLKMDIFADPANDRIQCTSATISGNLDIFAGLGAYHAQEYDLIITSGTSFLNGTFASSTISRKGLTYEIKYEDGIVKLIVDGVATTNFSGLSPLTYNQRQTAQAFDKLSPNPGQWASVLKEMDEKQQNGTDADIAAIKDFFARTSGYFLANAIRNMAADSPNNEVYDKIRCRDAGMQGCGVTDSNGLWVQLRGGLETFKKDENSLEDYRDLSYGVMAGFDRFLADKLAGGDVMWGVYGRFNKNNIEQGENKADGNNNGLGFYGGYIRDSWELKAMLLGSYDMFSTQRMAYNSQVAKADITGVTVSADLEAAIKIWMSDNMNLRPYAGIEAANTMYGGFKESGAGMYDLDTRSGDYLRSAGRVGAGLDYEKGIWIWYANVEGKYVFEGTKPEIKSQFMDTGIDFYSRGADEKNLEIGAGAGAEVRISRHWKGFANAKYYIGEKYENIYGNIGIRYLFGKSKGREEIKKNREVNDAKAAQEKKAEAERRKAAKKAEALKKKAAETAALEAKKEEDEEAEALEAQRKAWEKKAALEAQKVQAEEEAKAKRIEEEAKITKEISDADLAKQKAEAEARRKRPMLKTYTLTMHFDTNSYFLSEEDKKQIGKIAQEVKNYDYKKIAIEGHTDSTGPKELNKRLSRQRARSVYNEFVNAGIPSEKMSYQGFAATMPVQSNKTAAGRAANRRTEIFVE